ncbi:hypothetical protein [Mycobacterium tuberculosis]|uniref:hypothetical protein n=1 Tax=Mycobacterium tuberculosis TaxID=1773 RepID=UPI00070D3A96|nr:hypothetical protein [Mycobacterium tuberculosis]
MSIARSAQPIGWISCPPKGGSSCCRCGGGYTHIFCVSAWTVLVVDLQAEQVRSVVTERLRRRIGRGAPILAGTLAPGVGLAAQNRELRQFTGRSAPPSATIAFGE